MIESSLIGTPIPHDPGDYVVDVESPGFLSARRQVSVVAGRTARIVVRLDRDATPRGGQVRGASSGRLPLSFEASLGIVAPQKFDSWVWDDDCPCDVIRSIHYLPGPAIDVGFDWRFWGPVAVVAQLRLGLVKDDAESSSGDWTHLWAAGAALRGSVHPIQRLDLRLGVGLAAGAVVDAAGGRDDPVPSIDLSLGAFHPVSGIPLGASIRYRLIEALEIGGQPDILEVLAGMQIDFGA